MNTMSNILVLGPTRSPGMTYTELLERNARRAPDILFEESATFARWANRHASLHRS
jgi:hypothetical protein